MGMCHHPCGYFLLEGFLLLILKLLLVGHESLPGGPLCLSTGGSLTLGHTPFLVPVSVPPGLPGPLLAILVGVHPVVLGVHASHDFGSHARMVSDGSVVRPGVPLQVVVLLFPGFSLLEARIRRFPWSVLPSAWSLLPWASRLNMTALVLGRLLRIRSTAACSSSSWACLANEVTTLRSSRVATLHFRPQVQDQPKLDPAPSAWVMMVPRWAPM